MAAPLVAIEGLVKRFAAAAGGVVAIDGATATLAAGSVSGLVGPDGAGKSTLMRLIAGLLLPDAGRIAVDGLDTVADAGRLHAVVGYMPQRFGVYEDLAVAENLNLYADLRGLAAAERAAMFERLLAFTGLGEFRRRLAGALSGGMKQKLGLACALMGRPRLLLLDEPSVGVDPVSRRELWRMVGALAREGMGVLWSTAYLDEAERCERVLLLDQGRLLYAGPPRDLTAGVAGRSFVVRVDRAERRAVQARAAKHPGVLDALIQGRDVRLVLEEGAAAPDRRDLGGEVTAVAPRFEDAFVALLAAREKRPTTPIPAGGAPPRGAGEVAVEARSLSRRFGDFRAVDDVSFAVRAGEIYGLLGPNGAGKSTTFKMMCGLLPASAGSARVAGIDLRRAPSAARARIGYMSQRFSLYGDLNAQQNLEFFAGAYGLSGSEKARAVADAADAFGLRPYAELNAGELPLGFKQRLALACALLHAPPILFLDEPTSGVDPLTRREFWNRINVLAGQGVTVMVTTHFIDEAEFCDRVGIIFRGRLIAEGSPEALKDEARAAGAAEPTLEDAFVRLIERRTEPAS